MKHFINLKDIPAKDLRKILIDAKKRKISRKRLSTLEVDQGSPLKGKLLIQMFEKSSLRTRLSFYLAIKQLGGGTITLRSNELHLGDGGESVEESVGKDLLLVEEALKPDGLIEELELETDYKINKMNVMLSKINKNKDLNV